MKKIVFLVPVCAIALACNKTESTATTAGSSSASTAATTTATTQSPTVSGVIGQALSFIGAGPFEGDITMTTTDVDKATKTITYEVKGQKMRFETPDSHGPMEGGYVIFDTTAKKMTAVNDAKKTAMVMDMGAMQSFANPAGAPAAPKPTIDKTGKNETIAGYSCEIWKMTEASGEKAEVCVAKGITFPAMGRQHGWLSALEDGFPLRAVKYDSAGKEKSRMEVTKIDKKSLDDSKFQVPAGYTTQDMGEMMKNVGALRGMAGGFRPPR